MLLGSIEENAGIFVVEEIGEDGKTNIIGQSLTIRQKGKNGVKDRLCFDNIEITNEVLSTITEEEHREILKIYKEAAQQAINTDKKFLDKLQKEGKITQEQRDRLVLKEVIAGTGYNDLKGLKELPEAEVVVPDEAYYEYKTYTGTEMPWIDSAAGKAPNGSGGTPVILAQIDKNELKKIEERQKGGYLAKVDLEQVPIWYSRVGEPKKYTKENITQKNIEVIKEIEKQAFRKEQQEMVNARSIKDLQYIFNIDNPIIYIGSNNSWYLIYGDEGDRIEITNLAIIGAMHSKKAERNEVVNEKISEETKGENSNETSEETIKGSTKLAVVESAEILYNLLIKAGKEGKPIYCDATKDTSLINIKRMLKKGLVRIYSNNGTEIIYDKEKGLIYKNNKEKVNYYYYSDAEEAELISLRIEPKVEKLEKEEKNVSELLKKLKEIERLKGKEKEEDLEEMRKQMRSGEESLVER